MRLASIISPSAMVHAMLSFQLRSKALEESAPSSWPPEQGARGALCRTCCRGYAALGEPRPGVHCADRRQTCNMYHLKYHIKADCLMCSNGGCLRGFSASDQEDKQGLAQHPATG